jgi:hypothetical protein
MSFQDASNVQVKKSNINYLYKLLGDISEDELDSANLFFRELETGGLFSKKDLLTKARIKKKNINIIVDFCLKYRIIAPAYWACLCGYTENELEYDICESCGKSYSLDSREIFELIAEVPKSSKEIHYEKAKLKELDKTWFKYLLARIKLAKQTGKTGWIAFVDIAHSTKLQKADSYLAAELQNWLHNKAIELSRSLLKYEQGYYLKAMGDAVWIFSLDQEELSKVILKLFQEFKNKNRDKYNIAGVKLFLKAYIASSIIQSYSTPDELTLDLEMEAFTFIARIEKEAQSVISKQISQNSLGFLVSRDEKHNYTNLSLERIKDYNEVSVFYKVF